MQPRPCRAQADTPKWFVTQVSISRITLLSAAEWMELELWNDGSPVNVVADASDQRAKCFEITFCHNDAKWT